MSSFLEHAIKLEFEAELLYVRAAEVIDPAQNSDAVAFFREMAGYASQHLKEAMQRAGMTEVSELPESGYVWGSGAGPESLSPLPVAGDVVDLDSAMINALKAESGAVAFYEHIAQSSSEAEVRMLAGTFAVEERAHVLALERFLGRKPY